MDVVLAYGIADAPSARGHVVVIDVLRAFTCAAMAFHHGADAIVLVSTTDEAFAVKRARPDVLLMGEVGGRIIPGFDYGNSPQSLDIAGRRVLRGRTFVQRTGCGTQGVVSATNADAVYLGSLPVASATCRHLRAVGAETVTLLAMGSPSREDDPEDLACRGFMAETLRGGRPAREPVRRAVWESPGGRKALDPSVDWISSEDLFWATQLDLFAFAMPVRREGGLLVARRTDLPPTERMDDRLPFDLQTGLARLSRRETDPAALPRVVDTLLRLGYEHPALSQLAGLTTFDASWARERLETAAIDLGLLPDEERALLALCVEAALRMVRGEERVERAAREICGLSEYGYEFRGADRHDWVLFDDDMWDERWTSPRTQDGWRAEIVGHARRVVERYGPRSLRI
jgi:2-phosphosulfolactate phosphatase